MPGLKTLAELVRLPNVFSAVADILLGFFLAQAIAGEGSWHALPLAIVASVCLYWAGMVLNDFFDADDDAALRPNRPIPSGRVSRAAVGQLGFGLLVGGVALAWAATPLIGTVRAGLVAFCVGASVLAYDGGLKRTLLGPVTMGACRFFNVLLGAALIRTTDDPWFPAAIWLAATGIGTYIIGVTLFARTEAVISARSHLTLASLIMLVGLALVAAIPLTADYPNPLPSAWWLAAWWLAIVGFAILIGWRVWPAIRDPQPARVQPTIGRLLRFLIFLDALALSTANVYVALAMLAFVPLAWLVGRWIYST